MSKSEFCFKKFSVCQDRCAMKVGTDGVLLGAWAKGGKRMLDIGSGTGLISLMMAQRFPLSLIDAIDVEIDCCIQAEENVNNSPFVDRIHVYRSSLQDYTCENKMYFFDSIVSNPPYFVNSLKSPDSKRSMARHSDCLPFDVLLKCVRCLLAESGRFSVILPIEVIDGFVLKAYHLGLYISREVMVKTTSKKLPSRCLLEFQKQYCSSPEKIDAFLMETDGSRSSWYQHLTVDFYLEK